MAIFVAKHEDLGFDLWLNVRVCVVVVCFRVYGWGVRVCGWGVRVRVAASVKKMC